MILEFITWNVNPEISVFGLFTIRWYGLLFAFGFLLSYFIMGWMFRKEGIPIKVLDKLTTYMVIATIVGARLGHCLFYEPAYYLRNPIDIFKIWEGGLASHGGAIGILIALFIFHRQFNIAYIWILDRIAVVTAMTGGFIRLGNLMNSEIIGKETDLSWGFIFIRTTDPSQAVMPRHPAQLYESLAYFLIFAVLLLIYYKNNGKTKNGLLFGLFMILVFGVRFFIEYLKEPQVSFESTMALNMGQLLSIPFVILGVGCVVYSIRKG